MAQREEFIPMPAFDEHWRLAGMLTGAAAHELNNILGILGLRLEKLREDRQALCRSWAKPISPRLSQKI